MRALLTKIFQPVLLSPGPFEDGCVLTNTERKHTSKRSITVSQRSYKIPVLNFEGKFNILSSGLLRDLLRPNGSVIVGWMECTGKHEIREKQMTIGSGLSYKRKYLVLHSDQSSQ